MGEVSTPRRKQFRPSSGTA
jgi:hypothetical protein